MTRIESEYTTRGETKGFIPEVVLKVAVEADGLSLTRTFCYDIGWQPIGQKIVHGISPSIFSFRALFNVSKTFPITFANYREVLGFSDFEDAPQVDTFGFTNRAYPPTNSELRDYQERLHVVMKSKHRAYIDVYQMEDNNDAKLKEAFLGRYWLTNIVGANLDGVTMVFSDARAINYEHRIIGRYCIDNFSTKTAFVFDPFSDVIFNPKMNGNHYNLGTVESNKRLQQLFDREWPNAGVNTESGTATAVDWTLWDIIEYIFAHCEVQNILTPTTSDTAWKLWRNNGGLRKQEVDLTGLTVTEAIDKVIRTAGDYSWTLDPLSEQNWKIRPFEYSRFSALANTQNNDADIDKVMTNRTVTIPTPGASLANTQVNISSFAIDEYASQQVGHLIVQGEPIIIESTFSTDGDYDFSCVAQDSSAASGVASLQWIGDLSNWITVYNATSGTDKDKRKAADAAEDVAYKVCALKTYTQSTINPKSGFAFAPKDGSWQETRRPFLPYRLPLGSSPSNPGEANEKPSVLVWIRKPGADADDWMDATSRQAARITGGFSIDPVVGGIRFENAMIDTSTMEAYDVMVTACIELDERLQVEVYQHDKLGKALIIQPEREMKMSMRWNALNKDLSANATEIVHDDTDSISDYASKKFAEYQRVRRSAMMTIPWIERIYRVGDWLKYVASGSSEATSSIPVGRQEFNAPIVGVEINYQDAPVTTLRTENWRQE